MNRTNFYYQQLVAESDLDTAFDDVETSIRALAADLALWGVMSGCTVAAQGTPDLTVAVAGGTAYDKAGKRLKITGTQTVDVSVDFTSASTTVSTPGNSRWISVYLLTDRDDTDARVDGNDDTIYYSSAESYQFKVKKGEADVSPNKPSLLSDGILLADILRAYGDTTIVSGAINTDRREAQFALAGGSVDTKVGTIRDAVAAIMQAYDEHVTGAADPHPATAVEYAGGAAWADGVTNPAGTVEATLDSIFSRLASTTTSSSGARKLGSEAVSGATVALTAGTLQSQLVTLTAALNTLHTTVVKLSGSQTITGAKIFDDATFSTSNLIKYGARSVTRGFGVNGALFDGAIWETLNNGDVWTARSLGTTAGTNISQAIVVPIDVPHNATITAASVRLVPNTGHGAVPAGRPKLMLVRATRTGGTAGAVVGTVTDNVTSNVAAYETARQLNLTGLSTTTDRTTYEYFLAVEGESSTNALSHVGVSGFTVTFTVTEQDLG